MTIVPLYCNVIFLSSIKVEFISNIQCDRIFHKVTTNFHERIPKGINQQKHLIISSLMCDCRSDVLNHATDEMLHVWSVWKAIYLYDYFRDKLTLQLPVYKCNWIKSHFQNYWSAVGWHTDELWSGNDLYFFRGNQQLKLEYRN